MHPRAGDCDVGNTAQELRGIAGYTLAERNDQTATQTVKSGGQPPLRWGVDLPA